MSATQEAQVYIAVLCVEGFFYGLYSGIFALYLQLECQSNKSRMAKIVFYALCLLHVLSTLSFVSDLVGLIYLTLLQSRITIGTVTSIDSLLELVYRIGFVELTASGCCDFLAQCILIYRCWIVWGQDIRVVIIPSFLAIAYLVTWLVENGASSNQQSQWGIPLTLTSLAASMAVNSLVTGLIVFKILRVFLEVKAASTSVERTLGSTGGTKLRHTIFVIIESGMALFAIQLVRVVLSLCTTVTDPDPSHKSVVLNNCLSFVIAIHEMLNGITPTIILVRVSMKLSFENQESFMEAAGTLRFNNDSDRNILQ